MGRYEYIGAEWVIGDCYDPYRNIVNGTMDVMVIDNVTGIVYTGDIEGGTGFMAADVKAFVESE